MGIALVTVGEVDQDIIRILKEDLNRIFGKQVWVGEGMPTPHTALSKKRNQYLSTMILDALINEKTKASFIREP